MITGIVVALPEELGTLTRHKIASGSSAFITGNRLVALSGAGPDNARRAAQSLVGQGAERLLSWGCAGALDETLAPGDLCVPAMLHSSDGRKFTTDAAWRQSISVALAGQTDICDGTLLESTRIVSSSVEKAVLRKQHGAHLLDMESCACAEVAVNAGLPFMAVRTIADPAAMDLPAAISHSMQENGQVAIAKLLFYILRHPQEIPALIRLGRHFQAAKTTLAAAGKRLFSAMQA